MPTTYEQFYKQALKQQQQSIQPALSAYQALIPITQQTYAQKAQALQSQKPLLEQRYQNLLSEINRKQTEETGQISQSTTREFGKRGIPVSSGVFDTTLQEKVSPVQQFYTGQSRDVGLEQTRSLQDLASQISANPLELQGALQAIYGQQASLRSQAAQGASGIALQLYQTELDRQRQAQEQNSLQNFISQYEARMRQLTQQRNQPAPNKKFTPVSTVSNYSGPADITDKLGGIYNKETGESVGGYTLGRGVTPYQPKTTNYKALTPVGKKPSKSPFAGINFGNILGDFPR